MTGPYEFREWMRDHEDTKREYRELNAKYEALRAQLAESEAARAGYRAALERAEYETQSFVTAFERGQLQNRHRDGGKAALLVIRQALDSNPGKAVGDVIAAARELPESLVGELAARGMPVSSKQVRAIRAALAKLEGRE